MKSKLTKATDISLKVKKEAWERDGGKCVVCGNRVNVMPNAHYIRRSQGGLGIAKNIFTACTNLTGNQCHRRFDEGTEDEQEKLGAKIRTYFKSVYPDWDEKDLYYRKYGEAP